MIQMNLKLTGTRALLLHNGRLADPTHESTKAIKALTAGRGKTETVHAEIRRLEWLGSLYEDAEGRISVTEDMVLGCGIAGAKSLKKGKLMTAAVLGTQPFFPIEYKGPKDKLELYNTGKFCDYRGVVIQRSRTMRARPRFDEWSVKIGLMVDEDAIEQKDVLASFVYAGRMVGLGDFRPRFGRFTVERIK